MSAVSVLIAVYANDDPELFRESLHSNVLGQTEMPDQLVVVVDGPVSDAIDNVLEEAHAAFDACRGADFMTVLRLPKNRGVAAAMNQGIPCCRCELIARADDLVVDLTEDRKFEHDDLSDAALAHDVLDRIGGAENGDAVVGLSNLFV